MKFICDAPGEKSWFRIETTDEAAAESAMMRHAVEKYFRAAILEATTSFRPASSKYVEREIGLTAHLFTTMPLFLTLRDAEGTARATAMLPPNGQERAGFRPIIVGAANGDPYPAEADAIDALARHFNLALDRARCFPYRQS
jgi:hypothetical protein